MNKQVRVLSEKEAIKTILGLIDKIETERNLKKEEVEEQKQEIPSFIDFLNAIAANKNNELEEDEFECDCEICQFKDECDQSEYEEDEEDDYEMEEDLDTPSFPEFLGALIKDIAEKSAKETEEAVKPEHKESKENVTAEKLEYNFMEMIKEFENGYTGAFTNNAGDVVKYDEESKTLLIVTEVGTYPATITSRFMSYAFRKKEIIIANGKALELAREGKEVYFTVDVFGTKVKGHVSVQNDMPSFKIYNQVPGVRSETIVIMALFHGTWSL